MREGFARRVALETGGFAVAMAAGSERVRKLTARAAMRTSCNILADESVRMMKAKLKNGRSPRAGADRKLSPRQLKAPSMRSGGLTSRQVAIHIGRHEKTVECHVIEILRRLGAPQHDRCDPDRDQIEADRVTCRLNPGVTLISIGNRILR